ncbi:MAG: hypothetical protein ACTHU0_17460 [Kofleriaceae bacterium]
MTSRELIAWSALYERRARAGWWTSRAAIAVLLGAAIAGWVAWRAEAGPLAASQAWLIAAVATFGATFLRIPFEIYGRRDAALLAQLPIEGTPLFDAALVRCVRTAAMATAAVAIGALPLGAAEPIARHLALAGALGIAAGLLVPAVVVWTASLVALEEGEGAAKVMRATGAASPTGAQVRASTTAILGAVPGAVGAILIVLVVLVSPWLTARPPHLPAPPTLAAIAIAGLVAILGARQRAARAMGQILRDVSALDRQRLATLEIRPPTALEGLIANLLGSAALPYRKDARMMRRRYPLAFALGALAFLVLAITGLARPAAPEPWLGGAILAAAAYALALAGRLRRPPIELPKLSASLPISAGERARAKLGWLLGWWAIYVAAPGAFAVVRQADVVPGLAILGGATLVVIAAGYAAGLSGTGSRGGSPGTR